MTMIVNAGAHGHWVTLTSASGVTHLAWSWNSGATLGYLCCTEPEWLEDVELPQPDLKQKVTCMMCLGTTV